MTDWQIAPRVMTGPPEGGAVLRGAIASLRKRGITGDLDPVALLRPGVMLDAARIHAYAQVCGFGERGGVPLTYPHLLAFPLHMAALLAPSFPFPAIGLVHLENTIVQHAKLDSGDRLDVMAGFGAWITHEKGQAFTVESRIARAGQIVWESASLYLRLGVDTPKGAPYQGLPADELPLATIRRFDLPANLGRRYARVSGDSNPIHTSAIAARMFGFPRPIAHGMWTKAHALAQLLPDEPIEHAEVRVAFKTPAFLPGGACLMVAPDSSPLVFELRDRREQKPHLRGLLKDVRYVDR